VLALALLCGAGSAAALTLGDGGPQHTPAVRPSAGPSTGSTTPAPSWTPQPSARTTEAQTLGTPSDVSPSSQTQGGSTASSAAGAQSTPPEPTRPAG
jgi:hypothetical protein